MKNNNILGWGFILLSLLIGSLFTASCVDIWKTSHLTLWLIPFIIGILFFWIATMQLIIPLCRDYRKPRTQRQWENIRPLYQLFVALLMAYLCLSIALGGAWIYWLKDEYTGTLMGATGLLMLVIPIAYMAVVAIKAVKK